MDRSELELATLAEVSHLLSGTLDVYDVFDTVMSLLGTLLGMEKGTLVLPDGSHGQLHIVAALGLSEQEKQRGQYALGEGITGRVVASGQPRVVHDITSDSKFLNRTGSRGEPAVGKVSFICVPIKINGRPVGAISVDKHFVDEDTLQGDVRLLTTIASIISLALQISRLATQQRAELQQINDNLRKTLRGRYHFQNIIGSSQVMMEVFDIVNQVAASRATVLLEGETGTGKELIAKAIHFNSPRKNAPFIRVNCGALSETLLESELFGHVKGAFTGAIRDKVGRFEASDGGTLFLDEIGTLSTQLQVKLLRVLQERQFERVGDMQTLEVNTRVVAATNLKLEEEVKKGNFREDLFYRLNVIALHLPPLRNRRDDVPALIDHFLDRFNHENHKQVRKMSRELMDLLLRYSWPGNVRELENAIERTVVLASSDTITEELLPLAIRMFAQKERGEARGQSLVVAARQLAEKAVQGDLGPSGTIYPQLVGMIEQALIERAMEKCDGIKVQAADFLGINRNTLNKKLSEMSNPKSTTVVAAVTNAMG